MDLNYSNGKDNRKIVTTSITNGTLIDGTDISDIRGEIDNLSANSMSTSGTSTAIHVELKSSDKCLDMPDVRNVNDDNLVTIDNNDSDERFVGGSPSHADTKPFNKLNNETSFPQSDHSIESTTINEAGGSVTIDNLSTSNQPSLINIRSNPGDSRRVRFKKNIVTSSSTEAEDSILEEKNKRDSNLKITISQSGSSPDLQRVTITSTPNQFSDIASQSTSKIRDVDDDSNLENIELNESLSCLDHYDNDSENSGNSLIKNRQVESTLNKYPSSFGKASYVGRIYNRLTNINLLRNNTEKLYKYSRYEDEDLIKGSTKYNNLTSKNKIRTSRTFRGSYKFSRAEVSMAVSRKTINLLSHKSTFALFGAFLIHVTLGTVYTLSNVNSYMTSYMRKHGSPNATYGAAVWLSSSYSVGQGVSMVLGGYLEKRFSARLACIIGCAIHSISIMSTSWTIDYGILPVLISYGILPGFGCGLAYMTPMSNGFGWFPNRRGLVAGVILAGFGIGTFVFNMAQTGFVNPLNLSPQASDNGYFTQKEVLDRVPHLFTFLGSIYALMQLIGCSLLFPPPRNFVSDERPIIGNHTELDISSAVKTTEFKVLFVVYGLTTQGVLFINSILKEYGQLFIKDDSYLAWAGSMASIANSLGRLVWGLAIDKYTFTFCFTSITIIFGTGLFLTPFEFVLSSKLMYLICTLVMFGSFSGWMSSYPVHLSRVFGRTNSGMIYGLIYISQAVGGIITAFGTHYLIDNYNRFVPFYCICSLELLGLMIYLLFYPKYNH